MKHSIGFMDWRLEGFMLRWLSELDLLLTFWQVGCKHTCLDGTGILRNLTRYGGNMAAYSSETSANNHQSIWNKISRIPTSKLIIITIICCISTWIPYTSVSVQSSGPRTHRKLRYHGYEIQRGGDVRFRCHLFAQRETVNMGYDAWRMTANNPTLGLYRHTVSEIRRKATSSNNNFYTFWKVKEKALQWIVTIPSHTSNVSARYKVK